MTNRLDGAWPIAAKKQVVDAQPWVLLPGAGTDSSQNGLGRGVPVTGAQCIREAKPSSDGKLSRVGGANSASSIEPMPRDYGTSSASE